MGKDKGGEAGGRRGDALFLWWISPPPPQSWCKRGRWREKRREGRREEGVFGREIRRDRWIVGEYKWREKWEWNEGRSCTVNQWIIYFRCNQLRDLPSSLFDLPIRIALLGGNMLESLPRMTRATANSLAHLDISYNKWVNYAIWENIHGIVMWFMWYHCKLLTNKEMGYFHAFHCQIPSPSHWSFPSIGASNTERQP